MDESKAARILLVEDESIIRLVTAELLRDEGFEVTEAWDGDEASRLLGGRDRFDALFTDVQMPGKLDGVDVARIARHQHPAIPVLVASGYAPQLIKRLSTIVPPVTFLSKPYDLDTVVEILNRLISKL